MVQSSYGTRHINLTGLNKTFC